MTPEELQVPPSEAEIADVIHALAAVWKPLADIGRRLVFQRDRLREQFDREHEAWDAITQHGIQVTGGPRFASSQKWLATFMTASRFYFEDADDPIEAVRAVVKAVTQEEDKPC